MNLTVHHKKTDVKSVFFVLEIFSALIFLQNAILIKRTSELRIVRIPERRSEKGTETIGVNFYIKKEFIKCQII